MTKKRLAILGATGSIGQQALEVVALHPDLFTVEVMSGHSNVALMIAQAERFQPNAIVVTHEESFKQVKSALNQTDIKVYSGEKALNEVVQWDTVDLVLGAIVGFAGLQSTLSAIDAGKPIALANKETLVVAGNIVMQKAAEKMVPIIPVDSEHSAIYQCLTGEKWDTIDKVILTASGGPFLGKKPNFLVNVKKDHALQHPNWSMGAKITIDSSTLMNKGLEMIEAKWLFGLDNDQIEVVIHPQSIIHSLVQFNDGSLKAQLGLPDMKLPIQYALSYPQRIENNYKRFSFNDYAQFTFEKPDLKTFRNLQLAMDAMEKGGNMPCILNAANEIVVDAFLKNKVGFLEMSDIIEQVMSETHFVEQPDLESLAQTNIEVRKATEDLVKHSQYYN